MLFDPWIYDSSGDRSLTITMICLCFKSGDFLTGILLHYMFRHQITYLCISLKWYISIWY